MNISYGKNWVINIKCISTYIITLVLESVTGWFIDLNIILVISNQIASKIKVFVYIIYLCVQCIHIYIYT